MGRKLGGSRSPLFLYIGVSLASFSVLGKSPFLKQAFIIRVRGGERLVAQALTSLGDTLSKPDEVFDERVFISLQVWWLSISFSLKVFSLFER